MDKQEEFMRRLQATFRTEAEEHIRTISDSLLALEKEPEGAEAAEIIETMFRGAHSLKGAARSVNRRSVEHACQALEDIFSLIKQNKASLSPESFDLLHEIVDGIAGFLSKPEVETDKHAKDSLYKLLEDLIEKIKSRTHTGIQSDERKVDVQPTIPPFQIKDPETSEMVRIPRTKLEPLFIQAEELIQTRAEQLQRIKELYDIHKIIQDWKIKFKNWENKQLLESSRFERDWIVENEHHLNDVEYKILMLIRSLENGARVTSRMVNKHVEDMKTLLMLPVSIFVESFPRLVRDLSRSKGKEIELVMERIGIEVDKRVLDEMKDPLIHLIRNSVDHGIESPQNRIRLNKNPKGSIVLSFSTLENNCLEVMVSDDGEGINLKKLETAVLRSGLMSKEEFSDLSFEEQQALIYRSGITTSKMITDISGRGLGMTIVHEKVMKLGGTISIESIQGKGTSIRMLLPLTLATFRGVMIKAEGCLFVLPIIHVDRILRIRPERIKTVENKATIVVDGNVVSYMEMAQVLGLPAVTESKSVDTNGKDSNFHYKNVVLLRYGKERVAFQVDEIISQQEILVKELGKQIAHLHNISGACVLGTGEVVPILNVSDLMTSATRIPAMSTAVKSGKEKPYSTFNILVAEDSITSRTLLKNILESAGYHVVTAVDGSDAYTKALENDFDLVVSDVDMPRMNGFELITKIRNNKKLIEIPVVLVTALDSREDRERGIEVGANAYIVKSSFDQSNLLEVVQRLL